MKWVAGFFLMHDFFACDEFPLRRAIPKSLSNRTIGPNFFSWVPVVLAAHFITPQSFRTTAQSDQNAVQTRPGSSWKEKAKG